MVLIAPKFSKIGTTVGWKVSRRLETSLEIRQCQLATPIIMIKIEIKNQKVKVTKSGSFPKDEIQNRQIVNQYSRRLLRGQGATSGQFHGDSQCNKQST